MSESNNATRRSMLGMTVGGAAALATAGAASAAAKKPARHRLDLSNPKDHLKAFMLMRGALDEQLVIGNVVGKYYGVVDGDPTPLWGVLGATFTKFRRAPDGGYVGASYEIPYFTDLETGEVIDSVKNPYTGEVVSIPFLGVPASKIAINANSQFSVPGLPPGISLKHSLRDSEGRGDNIWIVEETMVSAPVPGSTRKFHYNEVVTLHARREDLEAPGVKRVRCETAFHAVVSWRPWMNMGDRPGNLVCSGYGAYGVKNLQELPLAWQRATAARHPEALTNPAGPVDKLMAS